MNDVGRRPGPGDPELERRLGRWLADLPEVPERDLVVGPVSRTRSMRQRPRWFARLWPGRATRAIAGPLLVGATLVVALAIGLRGVVIDTPGASPSTAPGQASSSSPQATSTPFSGSPPAVLFDGRVVRTLPLERRATALGAAFDALWLADDGARLLRIDPASGLVLATIELGVVGCGSIAAVAGSLWLSGCPLGGTTDGVVTLRVDPDDGTVLDRYDEAPGDGVGATAMNGLVWFVTDVAGGVITGVDAVSGQRAAELAMGYPVRHVTAGFGSLWVAPIGRPEVIRIDPDDGRALATVRLSGDPSVLLTTADAIWVAEPHQWLLGRIDPVADRVAAELEGPVGIDQLLTTPEGSIWGLGDAEAVAVDGASNTVVDRLTVPLHVGPDGVARHVLAAVGGAVWFADGRALVEISPP